MSIENELFEAIRCEDVVVFVGAGFSKYAGYPLGGQLGWIIHSELPEVLQPEINKDLPLDYLTDEIVRKMDGTRDFLNKVLDKVFNAVPKSLADHQSFAAIPHLKTIITTNYDNLFEQVLGKRGNVLFRDEHVSQWDDNKVNIIKIHGDLSDKSSIILTKEDYSTFIAKDFSLPLWASVISKISSKQILFLGYGYEDPNIWVVINKITQSLGVSSKAMYFVAPDQHKDKIDFLSRKNIHYLDFTGEAFLQKLHENIMQHIFKDFEEGRVSPETFRLFTRGKDIAVDLISDTNGFKPGSISGANGKEASWNAKFSCSQDSDYQQRHLAFFNTNEALELVLTAEELLKFNMTVGGMRIMDMETFGELSIKKTPRVVKFDLAFLNDGLDIHGIKAQVYSTNGNIRVLTNIHSLKVEVNVKPIDAVNVESSWNLNHGPIFLSVTQEIEVQRFLINLFRQKPITILLKDSKSFKITSPVFNEHYTQEAEALLQYFEDLRKVEQAFGIKFRNFSGINFHSRTTLQKLIKVINGESFERTNEYSIDFEEMDSNMIQHFEQLDSSSNREHPLSMLSNTNLTVTLHDVKLAIPGYRIDIPHATVKNLNELKSGATKRIVFASHTGNMTETFYIQPLPSIQ